MIPDVVATQLARWAGLAKSAGLTRANPKAPAKVTRAFAEELILCPNEAAARRQIERDPAGAAAFAALAGFAVQGARTGGAERTQPPNTTATPFYELAGLVLEFLKSYALAFPDDL